MATADLDTLKQEVFDYILFMLGGGMVDVELDPEHYETALTHTFRKYRQLASNGSEDSFGFLQLIKNQQEYTLPNEVLEVRQVFRRSVGSANSDSATQFEPFEAAYVNTYLLQAGRMGGLATYDFWAQYQELSARMFGGFLHYTWNSSTKLLTLTRKIEGDGEDILMWLYNWKPDAVILEDISSRPWIQEYALALCKYMLGEARSKFSTIAGPQGGTSLNGDSLKAEAQQEMEKLESDLRNYVDGSDPLTFIIG